MPLTPTDVANKQFNIKMRGYALDEVDAFLDEVEGELARLLRDNHDIRSRSGEPPAEQGPGSTPMAGARRPDAEPAAPQPDAEPAAPPAPQPAAPQPAGAPASLGATEGQEAALRTLLLAQRTADEVVAEARGEAAQIVETARAESEQTLGSAREEAEQTLTAARTESQELRSSSQQEADTSLSAARSEAERTLTAAREQAGLVEREALARVQSLTGDLEERRTTLESRIEELRAFEREYRTRLRAYLENQLRDLTGRGGDDDGAGSGVPAGAGSAAVGLAPAARPEGPPQEAGGARLPSGADAVGPFGTEPPRSGDDPARR